MLVRSPRQPRRPAHSGDGRGRHQGNFCQPGPGGSLERTVPRGACFRGRLYSGPAGNGSRLAFGVRADLRNPAELDATYRIYDFDRLENGRLRPLHLDQALEVIRFDERPAVTRQGGRSRQTLGGAVVEPLVSDSDYTVDRIEINSSFAVAEEDRFQVFSMVGGAGRIIHAGKEYPVKAGETWFLPAGLKAEIRGLVTTLRSTV